MASGASGRDGDGTVKDGLGMIDDGNMEMLVVVVVAPDVPRVVSA